MQKFCSATHPLHSMTVGKTMLALKKTSLMKLSTSPQFFGMWHQKLLPNIQHNCHFSAIRSEPENSDQPS
jgi:hypothetical protein